MRAGQGMKSALPPLTILNLFPYFRVVFCEAFKKGLYGEKIQWLIVGMYEDHWWNTSDSNVDCSPNQVCELTSGFYLATLEAILLSNCNHSISDFASPTGNHGYGNSADIILHR